MIKFRYVFLLSIVWLFIQIPNDLPAQKVGTWIFGYNFPEIDTPSIDTGIHYIVGANFLSFNPLNFSRYFKTLTLNQNVTNMWDKQGNLQFYCNGSKIFNYEHKLMGGGDSLKYSKAWNSSYAQGYYADHYQFVGRFPNSIVCPHPSNDKQYYLFYIKDNYDTAFDTRTALKYTKVVYCLIDMSLNNDKGQVIIKEKELLYGDFAPVVAATKHANGRDWWLAVRGYQDTNCYYFFLLNSTGVSYHHKQCIGLNINNNIPYDYCHGLNFSPDGKQLACYTKKGLEVFDFNRCMGLLSNTRQAFHPLANDSYKDTFSIFTLQVGFSPNSQYVYILNSGSDSNLIYRRVYQYDTKSTDFARSGVKVAEYDGFRDTFGTDTNQGGWEANFFSIQIAPDNKIYLGTIDDTRYLHVIEEPDKKGAACNFRQHAIKLPAVKSAIPMYPNYALGADSSSCGSGVQLISNNEELIIYPNPASEYLTVESQKSKVGGIKLANPLGQEMAVHPEPSGRHDGKGSVVLDVRELPQGLYILTITGKDNNLLKQEKLCIQH